MLGLPYGPERTPEYIRDKQKRIAGFEGALARMVVGLYGVSRSCGGSIAQDRLESVRGAICGTRCRMENEGADELR